MISIIPKSGQFQNSQNGPILPLLARQCRLKFRDFLRNNAKNGFERAYCHGFFSGDNSFEDRVLLILLVISMKGIIKWTNLCDL